MDPLGGLIVGFFLFLVGCGIMFLVFGGLFTILGMIGYIVTWPFDRLVRAFDKDL